MRFEFERCHDVSLPMGPPFDANRITLLLQMLAHGIDKEGTNHPSRTTKEQDETNRANSPRIECFLWKTGLNKTGDINLLAVRVHARSVERLQGVLVGFLCEGPLAFEPLIGSHNSRKRL